MTELEFTKTYGSAKTDGTWRGPDADRLNRRQRDRSEDYCRPENVLVHTIENGQLVSRRALDVF